MSGILTWRGGKKGKEKAEAAPAAIAVVSSTLADNHAMHQLSERLRDNTLAVQDNTASIQRWNDIQLLVNKSK